MHGTVRIFGDYAGFTAWVAKTFRETILGGGPAELYATLIPWIEVVLGALLVVGLLTRTVLVAGQLFMATLIFGMSLKQNWDTVAFQMVYAGTFAVLLFTIRYNRWSVDHLFEGTSEGPPDRGRTESIP